MINQLSTLFVFTILICVCAQTNPKFKYSTNDHKNSEDATHIITFPEHVDDVYEQSTVKDPMSGVPMEILQKLNSIENISQFFDEILGDNGTEFASRFGDNMLARNNANTPQPAFCKPTLQVVPLIPPSGYQDSTTIYFPMCTRVKRCGGCCTPPIYSCQPVEKKNVLFKVVRSKFTGGSTVRPNGTELIFVEEHTRCGCLCKMTEQDCNEFQIFNAKGCRCDCKQKDDQQKCEDQNKIWLPDSCTCRCRNSDQCTSGTIIDENTCRCVENDY